MGSGITKLADKAFVIGFLVPSLLAELFVTHLFGCPTWAQAFCTEKPEWIDLTYQALSVYFAAIVLMMCNNWLYRFYEGYKPPISWMSFLERRHENLRSKRDARIAALKLSGEKQKRRLELDRLLIDYAKPPKAVLKTSFGNRIQAFETYPRAVYCADSIPIWSRLQAVIPKDYQTALSDAKAQVDLAINTSVLSIVIAALQLAYFFLHIAQNPKPWTYLYGTLIATACSYLMYRLGVDRVPSWGSLVKGAFDCFLPKLASQMGYKIDTDRSSFWLAVSQQLLYWNPISNNFSTQGSLADAKSKEVEEQSEGSEFDVEDDNDADDDDSDNTDDDDGEEDDLKGEEEMKNVTPSKFD